MITAHPKVRIQYLRDSQAVYTANGAEGIAGFVYSRSGLGAMQGLTVAQGIGVIDPDYRGEITVVLLNTSNEERRLRRGDRIAQLVFQPALQVELEECETLGATGRGSGGFGHTGKH